MLYNILDLNSGFFHVCITKDFANMPSLLCRMDAATFWKSRLAFVIYFPINATFQDLIVTYFDDLIIPSYDAKENMQKL